MIAALGLVLACAYAVQLISVAVWVVSAKLAKSSLSHVGIFWPTVLRFRGAETELRIGVLPLFTTAVIHSPETAVGVGPERDAWGDRASAELASRRREARRRRPMQLRYRYWELASSAVVFLVGVVLLRGDVALSFVQAKAHLVQLFTEVWPPWSDGAHAVRQALAFLAEGDARLAAGIVMVRIAAMGGAAALLKLPLLAVGREKEAFLFTLSLFGLGVLWAIALVCAPWT